MWTTLTWIILLLTSWSVSTGKAQQHKRPDGRGCYDTDWVYHDHTQTCIKLISYGQSQTWESSQRLCQRYRPGDKKTHLVVIKDAQTNSFLKDELLTSSYQYAWIGLYKGGTNWHWQGLAEKVNFTKWEWELPGENYVYMTGKGYWRTSRVTHKFSRFLCQHDAVIPGVEVTCPSPVRESTQFTGTMTCRFGLNEDTVIKWESVRTGSYVECLPCEKDLPSHSVSVSETGLATIKFKGRDDFTRRDEDTWACSIFRTHGEGEMASTLIANNSCSIRVYEPADNIRCDKQVQPDKITVSCSTDKIYPRAKCVWQYRWTHDRQFQTVADGGHLNVQVGQSPKSTPEFDYFKSTCSWVVLPSNTIAMRGTGGTLEVKALMYPDVDNADREDLAQAVRGQLINVTIEPPDTPFFEYRGQRVTSPVFVQEDEKMELTCKVQNGRPTVESTTISCEFLNQQTNMEGSLSQIQVIVTNVLHGKTCQCWGNHITRVSFETSLEFNVTRKDPGTVTEDELDSGTTGKSTLVIVGIGSGIFVIVILFVAMATFFYVRRKRRNGRTASQDEETEKETDTQDVYNEIQEYDKVIPKGQDHSTTEASRAASTGGDVMIINDIYGGIGGRGEHPKDGTEPVGCDHEGQDETEEASYANTSGVTTSTPAADDKSVTSDLSKRSAKQRRRANDLVYVEVEFDQTTRGSDRKIKIKSEDKKIDYALVDFESTASHDE